MTRRILAVLLAVVLAVIGAVSVLLYVNTADSRALAGKKAVTVLVAKERIPAGTSGEKIRGSGLVEKVRMPAETVPAGVMDTVGQELDELVVTSELQASQLLLRGMFGQRVKSTGGLPVPDGKLAVSVEVTMPEQVAGFVRPGSTIAIFNTFNMIDDKRRESNGEGLRLKDGVNQATRTLLPKVEVLAIGAYGQSGTKTSNGKASDTSRTGSGQQQGRPSQAAMVVTVAVTQKEAERLVHAARTSELYLALVTGSSDVKPGTGVDNHSLFN